MTPLTHDMNIPRAVILMRHAKSSWDDEALTDHQRPLNQRGMRDAPRMAGWLASQTVPPDWCLCSDATRTRQTFQLMSEVKSFACPVEYLSSLYHAGPGEIIGQLKKLPDEIETPLIIAHNPGLEELACLWGGDANHFPTAAIIGFRFSQLKTWQELSESSICKLLFFQVPKELD